eukprot:1160959-Pelagomonas_calceolata.AAC.1
MRRSGRSPTEALAHTQVEVHPNRRPDSTLNGKATGCCQCPSLFAQSSGTPKMRHRQRGLQPNGFKGSPSFPHSA